MSCEDVGTWNSITEASQPVDITKVFQARKKAPPKQNKKNEIQIAVRYIALVIKLEILSLLVVNKCLVATVIIRSQGC